MQVLVIGQHQREEHTFSSHSWSSFTRTCQSVWRQTEPNRSHVENKMLVLLTIGSSNSSANVSYQSVKTDFCHQTGCVLRPHSPLLLASASILLSESFLTAIDHKSFSPSNVQVGSEINGPSFWKQAGFNTGIGGFLEEVVFRRRPPPDLSTVSIN